MRGGQKNLKSMQLPSMAIFFRLLFTGLGAAMVPVPCLDSLVNMLSAFLSQEMSLFYYIRKICMLRGAKTKLMCQ